MVLGVGSEVVDVNVGEARYEELQLLFIENRNEPLGDDVVEAFQERIQSEKESTGTIWPTY